MVSASDKISFDLGADLEDGSYKSCFARSVAVNSQYKHSRSGPELKEQLRPADQVVEGCRGNLAPRSQILEAPDVVRLRKNARSFFEDSRRLSCSSIVSSRRASICSSRIAEIPVENIVQQSKVDTLQWQLKETEKSREMYKAVMKQVVTFLEKAHRSLELLGTKMNSKGTVARSKSEHQIVSDDGVLTSTLTSTLSSTLTSTLNCSEDYRAFRDFTWRRPQKQEASPEEIPPEKLSQEAFRLLRTAQSLLSTQEPNLTQTKAAASDDLEFLAQLAKEFPQIPEARPQRTTSFSLSPKLLLPEHETRISTAFNRKLSLQLNETRRNSCRDFTRPPLDSPRGSLAETDCLLKERKPKFKPESEKSSSPAGGSISSVEDESGFSSMTSFQDVGLPLVNEEITSRNVLLRSMLHNENSNGVSSGVDKSTPHINEDDIKLWQTPESHRRWSSTPVDCQQDTKNHSMKVLWV